MNWKKFVLSSSVAVAVIAISAATAQAQSHRRSGGGGGARMGSPGSMHHGGRGNWNNGSGNHWNRGGHRWHHRHSFYGGFGYPFGYGFYPYGWGYGYPYYGGSAALYYNGYNNGRVYDGRAAESGGGSVVAEVQRELARAGYYRGAVDGVIGNQTRSAIRAYERRNGLRVDGRIDNQLLESMGVS